MNDKRRSGWERIGAAALACVLGAVGLAMAGGSPPASITLGSLAQLYDSVTFDHANHVGSVGNCATCHHHTAGAGTLNDNCKRCHSLKKEGESAKAAPACKGCHPTQPFSAEYLRAKDSNADLYHTAQLGLKGAYHQSCLGCHAQQGGPVGCQDCHTRNSRGEAFYHADAKPVPGQAHH